MQGCLSINGEQMATVAFVSTYPTRQLSSSTKAGVTQLRWAGLVRGRSETACTAQLLAWLLQGRVSDVASFWSSWKLPLLTVICL